MPERSTSMADRVLVVDDDPDIRALVSEILEPEGYEVECACNGAEAVAAIRRRQPCTMLLDMQMPILDGWGVASALRELGLRVPTLVITSAEDGGLWAAEIAAEGFLAKPFELDELLAAIEHICPA
jgi:CheY-like chemotaxis protein